MIYPALSYTYLGTGAILISASSYLFYQIYRGSKSRFAYFLISFTMIDGVAYIGDFFLQTCLHKIYVGGQEKRALIAYAYANQTAYYFYFLGTLQTWIFAMKYWKSATNFTLTPSLISVETIRVIQWSVIIVYTCVIMAMYIWSMVTFAGFVNDRSLEQYYQWVNGHYFKIASVFWYVMICGSTFFVLFALFKFFCAFREIQKWNTNVCLNKRSLVPHLLLLIFITMWSTTLPYLKFESDLIVFVYPITDMLLQLTICYICLTMGSNSQLRKFRVTLDVSEGVVRFRLNLKESIIESEVFDTFGNESRNDSIFSNQEQNHLMNSQSLLNQRGCDEIMQQFFNGIEDLVEPQRQSVAIQEIQEV